MASLKKGKECRSVDEGRRQEIEFSSTSIAFLPPLPILDYNKGERDVLADAAAELRPRNSTDMHARNAYVRARIKRDETSPASALNDDDEYYAGHTPAFSLLPSAASGPAAGPEPARAEVGPVDDARHRACRQGEAREEKR